MMKENGKGQDEGENPDKKLDGQEAGENNGTGDVLDDLAKKKDDAQKVKDAADAATGDDKTSPEASKTGDKNDGKNLDLSGDRQTPDGPPAKDGQPPKPDVPKGEGLDKAGIAGKALQGAQEDGAKGAAKEAGKEVMKQAAKKKAQQLGLDVMMKSLASALAPILFWVAVIILVLIIAVGIIMFFVAMPGQIVGKCRTLANNLYKAWAAMIEGEDQMISTAQLAGVAEYIEKMGYDLKGEGFVSSDKTESDISQTVNDITNIFNKKYDDNSDFKDLTAADLEVRDGIIRRIDTGAVVDLNSEPLMAYLISDNQCFIIKNFNTTLDERTEGNGSLVAKVIAGIAAIIGAIVLFLTPAGWIISIIAAVAATAGVLGGSYLVLKSYSNPDYGRGLIAIYHEGSRVGIPDGYYDAKEKGYIALDAESKKLMVKRGWSNGTYTFDVDGWSGRYGMPLEFLLSVHLATQMPDLAIDMATSFQTEVEVLLHEVEGSMTAGILKKSGDGWAAGSSDDDFITYADVSAIGKEERGLLKAAWEGLKDFVNFVSGAFTGGSGVWTEEELEELTFNDRALCRLFEMGMPHSNSCSCCSHIPGSANSESECDGDLYGENGDLINSHTICTECKERAMKLIAAIKICNDKKWESYTPYISKVTDHWFRDVYFVMNEAEDEIKPVVKVDEDYFYETGERWTMYETWEEGESIPEGFKAGDYKLYEEGSSTPSSLSKAQVQEINEQIALGDTSKTRLVKKAITDNLEPNYDNDWSAYELNDSDNELPWTKMDVGQDAAGELTEDAIYKNEDASVTEDILIYYKETRPGDIKQVEDGQRTETNPKIKGMFLDNKYYKYDGSIERANAILEDRSRADNKVENYNTSSDGRTKELIAKPDINKDSLNAFSILENTHTLDADFIYRDFKELIVELNYFNKEDLSDKIQDVMQWPIPECGSAGWPLRKYEKGETYYGTLINSKVDLDFMKEKDVKKAEEQLGELDDELDSDTMSDLEKEAQKAAEEAAKKAEEEGKESKGGSITGNNGSITNFVTKAYEVHKEMEGNNWDYCVLGSGCDHVYGHGCGLNTSIQDAVAGHHNTCCATYVSWVLNEVGYGFVSHGAKATYDWASENGFTPITSYGELEPGDLLFNKSGYSGTDTNNIGHVQILGNDGEWLNAGSVNAINNPPKAYEANFIIGMRPNLTGTAKLFEGYEPEQAVVSPVTGKIIEKGTVNRTNIETGEIETVGFIKIQALDHYITADEGDFVTSENGCTTEDSEYDPENTYDPDKKEGYDYFYEEYRGVIDGCVLYIEGFDLTIDETLADPESEEISQYRTNEVYNMTDDLKEAQALWREDAKENAAPFFTDGEDIYIKEGTVIGKTREDAEPSEDQKGNGNYIRLILRDLEDSIMEDVETYIHVDQGKHVEVEWEFFYWLPYESGPLDGDGNGPEACGTVSGPNEVAVGIAQWTSIEGKCNNVAEVCKWFCEQDSSLCSELSVFGSYSASQICANFDDLKTAWAAVCAKDRDGFLELQMKRFYEVEFKAWVEDAGVSWLLDKSLVAQGTYASLKNWGPNLGWEDVINSGMSDEEIVKALLEKACPIGSTCGTLEKRWESQYVLATDILNGSFADVEGWIRTKQPSDKYGEGQNSGALMGLVTNMYFDPKFFELINRMYA